MKHVVCFFILCLSLLKAGEPRVCHVRLLGQVVKPNDYAITDGKTDLFTLIEKAGGIQQSARDGRGVDSERIVNGKMIRTRFKIDVAALMKEGIKSSINMEIQNGDTVTILERVL